MGAQAPSRIVVEDAGLLGASCDVSDPYRGRERNALTERVNAIHEVSPAGDTCRMTEGAGESISCPGG